MESLCNCSTQRW